MFRWGRKRVRRRSRRTSSITKHYQEHKESARKLVLSRLGHFNQHYKLEWKRVAIRNQRRCWGSCSSLKNLNFNYKIQFLPTHLQDYIIVHELCHLTHLHHRREFWDLVAEQIPDYHLHVIELKTISKKGNFVEYVSTSTEIQRFTK
ncbi:M48 family metallopeptidase [Candidatus Kaiserbacteria bacterium]|nr:M48 family metallopeptidase [Candidatus Kaiserbacteria bacterium]